MITCPVQIIFPPQFEPFQPYLSLPYIKGLLRIYGLDVTCFDANIDFYWWLFEKAERRGGSFQSRDSYLSSHVSKALACLKTVPKASLEYRWAINVVDEYLKLVSPFGVEITLTSLKVGNKYSSDDLRDYMHNKDNIFRQYFTDAKDHLLGPSGSNTYLFSLVVLDQLAAALTFAEEIKQRQPDSRIIVGGPLVSRLYKRLVKIPWILDLFDIIAPGEAYRLLPDILDLEHQWTGHVTPDFNDFNMESYLSCRIVLPYVVAHGCKWGRCAFCSHHLTYEGYRESNIRDVVGDLLVLSQNYGVDYISFSDEHLTPEQLLQLADLMAETGLDIKWSTFTRAEPEFADDDFTRQLYQSGCRMLMFGFESASQVILDAMRKGIRVEYFAPILESCKNANIAVRLDFMIGFPGETEEDVQQTFSFVRKHRDIIDTPFSSYAVAVFELRNGIPIMETLHKYGVQPAALLRGDLDEQYEYISDNDLSPNQKRDWRHQLIRFFKIELNAELIVPQNKTHQLIYKDLYDQGYFELPISRVEHTQLQGLWGIWSHGVVIEDNGSCVKIINYATGGELEASRELNNVIEHFKHSSNLVSPLLLKNLRNPSIFIKIVNFLYRNDYLIISDKEQPVKFKFMD